MERRTFLSLAAMAATSAAMPSAWAQQQKPFKIGLSMPQTGGLAAGGRASQLGLEIWRDDINAKGGLLGRPVELIIYDDKSSATESPAIYAKLLDVDKVDMIFAPYGTVQTAPVLPVAKQRGMVMIGNFAFQVNAKIRHDMWFNVAPWGPADSWGNAFLDIGQKAGGKTLAVLASDQEFSQNVAKAAKDVAISRNIPIVFEQNYPPSTVEFAGIIRSLKAAKPDMVYVTSYPPDTAGILRAVNEIGVGENVKIFGGGMVGVQFASVMENLGSLLNGVTNFNSWLPEPSMFFEGTKAFFEKYSARAAAAKVDALGYYLAPFGYAQGQLIELAVNGTKSFEQKAIAEYLHTNEMKTIVGPISFAEDGERKESATLMAQFRGVVDKNIEQFRTVGKQTILYPERLKSGELLAPFEAARK